MSSNLKMQNFSGFDFQSLILRERIDCLIVDSEDGFSQLGEVRAFLSDDLGYADTSLLPYFLDVFPTQLDPSIGQLADWCRTRSPEINLVVVPSRRLNSQLKGLILSPYDGAECYQQFANGPYSRPHRDFFYSVTWEALYQAFHMLGSRHPAVTHMSRVKTLRNEYKWECTFCQVEAAFNFSNDHQGLIGLTFWDPTPGNCVAEAVSYFHDFKNKTRHRPLTHNSSEKLGIYFVTVSWKNSQFKEGLQD